MRRIRNVRNAGLTLLAASALVLGLAPALAHEEPEDVRQLTVEEVLDSFVDAFPAMQEIETETAEKLQQASGSTESRNIRRQAQEEKVKLLMMHGLSLDQYNHIVELMNTDPELRESLTPRLAESVQ